MSSLTQRLAAKNATTGLNIISLFDGMSCGMLAAVRAGISVANYLASEIEKAPMAVSEANWGDLVTQIGNVLDAMDIIRKPGFPLQDLLVGGSPCQDFSMAGKRKGAATSQGYEVTTIERYLELKADGVEFEGQSYLFWEYVQVLSELQKQNPDIYFLLENVKMPEKWENVISQALGVAPVLINSARVSAQNRVRLYWTNISFDQDIKDRGIMLADILDLEISEADLHSDKCIAFMNKKVPDGRTRWEFGQHSETVKGKSACLTKSMFKGAPNNCLIDTRPGVKIINSAIGAREVGRKLDENGKRADDRADIATIQRHELREDEKSNCLTTVGKDSLVAITAHVPEPLVNLSGELLNVTEETATQYIIRRFTVAECEKLQTVPVGYCASVAKTHAYKMIGNGWTIEVIAIILRGILNPSTKPHHQPRKPFIQQDLFTQQSPTKEYAHV